MSVPALLTTQQVYFMLGNSPLWNTLVDCHDILTSHHIAHAVAGGVAVALSGYQRNTIDIDLLVNKSQAQEIKTHLLAAGYLWDQQQVQFLSPHKIPVQFLYSGDRAGRGTEIFFPDPSDPNTSTTIENIPVLSLPKLIESKIAAGQGDLRRTHKDFADVVELIIIHHLDKSFVVHLHKSVRKDFEKLVEHNN